MDDSTSTKAKLRLQHDEWAAVDSSSTPVDNCGASMLLPEHAAYLAARGCSEELALRAGIRSVMADEIVKLTGVTTASGGLAFPFPPDGTYVRVRLFGDERRYVAPAGVPVPVYLPDGFDGSTSEIAVVESGLKALVLHDNGIPAVGLGGAATTLDNTPSGRRLNDSWPGVSGKKATIVPDAGIAWNSAVARDVARLALALGGAGAAVFVASLPPNSAGGDQGPDDFIAGQGVDALKEVLAAAVPAAPLVRLEQTADNALAALLDDLPFLMSVIEADQATKATVRDRFRPGVRALDRALKKASEELKKSVRSKVASGRYGVIDGRLAVLDAETPSILANFTAKIVEDVVIDDGTNEEQRHFVIRGRSADTGLDLPPVKVSPTELAKENWPLAKWGAVACVEPGRGALDCLRAAVQELSDPIVRRVYGHTGFREVDGQLAFLHGGGAVGGVEAAVELGEGLDRVQLPEVPTDPREAVQLSLSIVDCAPVRVTVPIIAAIYGAPLCEVLPISGAIHTVGPSGSQKSSAALLAAQHFGPQDEKSLASWSSTFASIEALLHRAKDILTVVDDFAPETADQGDRTRRKAGDIVRAIGNRSGKGRLRSDLSARALRSPRGLVLSTGEATPDHHSIRARLFIVEIAKGDVDLPKLSKLQAQSHRLPHAMLAYILWLIDRLEDLRERLPRRFVQLRTELAGAADHGRTVELVAHLLVRLEVFMEFIRSLGLRDEAQATEWLTMARAALLESCAAQNRAMQEAKPAEMFIETLRSLLAVGEVRLVGHGGTDLAGVIGWKSPQDGLAHLEPKAATRAVQEALRKEGKRLPVTGSDLNKALHAAGYLAKIEPGHLTVKTRKGRVLVVRLGDLEGDEERPRCPRLFPGPGTKPGTPQPLGIMGQMGSSQAPVPVVPGNPQMTSSSGEEREARVVSLSSCRGGIVPPQTGDIGDIGDATAQPPENTTILDGQVVPGNGDNRGRGGDGLG